MPAAEVASVADEQELASYECAYHVLPTVAEGEVESVRNAIIAHIEKAGGIVQLEEAPQRCDLAYDIEKYIEGKNRKFSSAYFGWVRFALDPAAIETVAGEIEYESSILRYLIIRLTKHEAEQTFFFHEAQRASKVVNVGQDETDDIDPNTAETDDDSTSDEADTSDTESVSDTDEPVKPATSTDDEVADDDAKNA